MTDPIRIDDDTVAAYLIADLYSEAMRDPKAFLETLNDNFEGDHEHFAEILLVDEGDVPDDIRSVFRIGENDEERDTKLFDALRSERTFTLVTDAIRELETIIEGWSTVRPIARCEGSILRDPEA